MSRVLHVTVSRGGGAGIAARRGVAALRASGEDCELLTAEDFLSPGRLRWMLRLDFAPLRFYRRRRLFTAWSNGWLGGGVMREIARRRPSIVHLHWMGEGFLRWGELAAAPAPMVWTLHDAWPVTGGCHYPGDCVRYLSGCGRCPQLDSHANRDLSRWNLLGRDVALKQVRAWVSPSHWLAEMVGGSGRIPRAAITVVPNTLDLGVFSPARREMARKRLGIGADELVWSVGSLDHSEPRKGHQHLPGILAAYASKANGASTRILEFGGGGGGGGAEAGLRWQRLGRLRTDDEVADALAAADGLIVPSLQDNLPNVAVEAQACGNSIFGYDSGGLAEIVGNAGIGEVVPRLANDLLGDRLAAYGRLSPAERTLRREAARRRVLERYAPTVHAAALRDVYAAIEK